MALPDPVLTYAFEARVTCAPSERIGHGAGEEAWFTPITGGGDWSTTRGEATALDARYLLRAEDGTLIDIVNRGFWRASADVEARLRAGEDVDESEFYYRTSPVFRTDAPAHRWLAATVFVGLAREDAGQVCIRFYAVE